MQILQISHFCPKTRFEIGAQGYLKMATAYVYPNQQINQKFYHPFYIQFHAALVVNDINKISFV